MKQSVNDLEGLDRESAFVSFKENKNEDNNQNNREDNINEDNSKEDNITGDELDFIRDTFGDQNNTERFTTFKVVDNKDSKIEV